MMSVSVPTPDTAPLGPAARSRADLEAIKLEKRLCRQVGQAIVDYQMISAGDRVMVCVSGGKDSYSLLDILLKLQKRAPIAFEIVAVNLNQQQPGFPADVLPNYLKKLGIEWHVETQNTYKIVREKIAPGKTACSLCSRLRRGILYGLARRLRCSKIALGHHRDDILQTFFLNLFFAGRIKTMPPKLLTDSGEFTVIRPLAYVQERDLTAWAQRRAFPLIPCGLCGTQENAQRRQVGEMLSAWHRADPRRIESLFTALQNVVPSHLLDRNLFDFAGLPRETASANIHENAFENISENAADFAAAPLGSLKGIPVVAGENPAKTA